MGYAGDYQQHMANYTDWNIQYNEMIYWGHYKKKGGTTGLRYL
jgi:hypothetical protein